MSDGFEISGPLSRARPGFEPTTERERSLRTLLDQANGFHVRSAFVVLPSGDDATTYSLETYNAGEWKGAYAPEVAATLFFALDAFGYPFGIFQDALYQLDPETGEFAFVARDLRDLFHLVASSPDRVGAPLVEAWLGSGRSLAPRQRLAPKTPFLLGGRGALEDLYAADILERRDFNADLHAQTRNLPDGAKVSLEILP